MDDNLGPVYLELKSKLDEIDEKLDSLDDSGGAGRRKIVNDAIEANRQHVDSIAGSLKTQLESATPEITVGIYFGLVRELEKIFGKAAKETVDKILENQPKVEALITPEEAAEISKIRTEIYAKQKTLVELAISMGMGDGMELPRKRTGAKGKRGKRQASYITWSIDGVEVPDAVGTLKPVVELYDQYTKVGELTAAMKEAGVNLTDPAGKNTKDAEKDNVLSFTLPDGKTLTGVYNPPGADDDDEEDEEETEAQETE